MEKQYPVGKRELIYAGVVLLLALLTVNGLLYGGLNLVFSLGAAAIFVAMVVYLIKCGRRPTGYGTGLICLTLVILAGFVWSDDAFVKSVLLIFAALAMSLTVTIAAGKNRNDGRSIRSLGWAVLLPLTCGLGGLPHSMSGLAESLKSGKGKNIMSVLGGLIIAVPLLLILVPLLIRADAAFDGMMALLPDFKFSELFCTVFFGACAAGLLFTFGIALVYEEQQDSVQTSFKGVSKVTVSTVLACVCAIYLMYMVSQLAYLSGGLSGILPEDFTLAEYARRGFFEMALLCLLNLSVMVGSVALVRKDKGIPVLCRWLCGFIGLVTLFFVVSSAAKMGLYIEGYGLTRLRVLVLVITFFLGLCAGVVTVWLFVPRTPYMKIIFLSAMVLGAIVLWADVDRLVASYNVSAYLDGRLKHIDLEYLKSLSDGAVPAIKRLLEAGDGVVANNAREFLVNRGCGYEDIRGWNFASWLAER